MNLPQDNEYLSHLEKLYALEFTGMKLGLENISDLLHSLGNPQEAYPSIHIAGTNGKGSVSAMIAAALQANGYTTGLYTSPHLVNFTERIKINGEEIPRTYVAEFLQRLWVKVEEIHATFFEVTTALMFKYFADLRVDVAVIETGLGGRLDGTNVLTKPLATVITSIGLEHQHILGDTLEQIANEKAGIFKHGSPAIVNVERELHHVFRTKAYEAGTDVTFIDNHTQLPDELGEPPFAGKHQEQNVRTALATLGLISLPIDTKKAYQGIRHTTELTHLRGRLETISHKNSDEKGVTLIIDVGHNAHAFGYLAEYFTSRNIRPYVVAGFAKDKDVSEILVTIKRFAARLICVSANMHRALPAAKLHAKAVECGLNADYASTVRAGVDRAVELATEGETVLVVGSHYVVGEFLASI